MKSKPELLRSQKCCIGVNRHVCGQQNPSLKYALEPLSLSWWRGSQLWSHQQHKPPIPRKVSGPPSYTGSDASMALHVPSDAVASSGLKKVQNIDVSLKVCKTSSERHQRLKHLFQRQKAPYTVLKASRSISSTPRCRDVFF